MNLSKGYISTVQKQLGYVLKKVIAELAIDHTFLNKTANNKSVVAKEMLLVYSISFYIQMNEKQIDLIQTTIFYRTKWAIVFI